MKNVFGHLFGSDFFRRERRRYEESEVEADTRREREREEEMKNLFGLDFF